MQEKIIFTGAQMQEIEDNLSHFQFLLASMDVELNYLLSHMQKIKESIKKGKRISRTK